MFAEAGLEPPATTDDLLRAASALHNPRRGQYGIAWNAARGTALGHTVLMAMADFGQPVLDLPRIAGGFETRHLADGGYRPTIDTEAGLRAAEFLQELLKYSPKARPRIARQATCRIPPAPAPVLLRRWGAMSWAYRQICRRNAFPPPSRP